MPIIHAKPRRLTITISDHVYQMLLQTSDRQGRSLSNLAAYLLEKTLDSTSLTGVQP